MKPFLIHVFSIMALVSYILFCFCGLTDLFSLYEWNCFSYDAHLNTVIIFLGIAYNYTTYFLKTTFKRQKVRKYYFWD